MFPKEKQFANLLTKQNKKWEYPTKRFDLGDTTYRPDFYLSKEKLYIEVVGSRQALHSNQNKIKIFQKLYPKVKFKMLNPQGNICLFPIKYSMDMLKNKDYHIKISDENLSLMKKVAIKDKIRLSQVFDRAIELFLKIKKIIKE